VTGCCSSFPGSLSGFSFYPGALGRIEVSRRDPLGLNEEIAARSLFPNCDPDGRIGRLWPLLHAAGDRVKACDPFPFFFPLRSTTSGQVLDLLRLPSFSRLGLATAGHFFPRRRRTQWRAPPPFLRQFLWPPRSSSRNEADPLPRPSLYRDFNNNTLLVFFFFSLPAHWSRRKTSWPLPPHGRERKVVGHFPLLFF